MVTYDGLRGEFFQILESPWVKEHENNCSSMTNSFQLFT